MNPLQLIKKYYPANSQLYKILTTHSTAVAAKAQDIARKHPELNLDTEFLYEAAMLHDLGVFLTDAPSIHCHGEFPYICHGYLGADLLRREGFPRHALVCERHTGTGISLPEIERRNLPLPHRDMQPQSLEEQVICFADKFFSKTRLDKEKTVEEARISLGKLGAENVAKFDRWCAEFL